MPQRITSRKNPLIVNLRKLLAQRDTRQSEGMYVAEGTKMLQEALQFNAPLTLVVAQDDFPLPQLPAQVEIIFVPKDLFSYLSTMPQPQGVLFVCKMQNIAPPKRLLGQRYLVLDGLQDTGNVGTIWRTADGFGADGLLLVNHCADPFNPKTLRASMGACFRLPIYELDAPAQLKALLDESNLPLYATALDRLAQDVRQSDLTRCAVAIGSEGKGVSEQLLNLSAQTIFIPMRTRCESLNAAAAASVICWEMARDTL